MFVNIDLVVELSKCIFCLPDITNVFKGHSASNKLFNFIFLLRDHIRYH